MLGSNKIVYAPFLTMLSLSFFFAALYTQYKRLLVRDYRVSHEHTNSKHRKCIFFFLFFHNHFQNKPWFLRVCTTSLLETLWEKRKLLVTRNFSFSRSVFYPFGELSAIFNEFEIVVCKLFCCKYYSKHAFKLK